MIQRFNPSVLLRNLNWRTKALGVLFLSLVVFVGAITVTQLVVGIPNAERSDIEVMRRQLEQLRARIDRREARLQTQAAEFARSEVAREILAARAPTQTAGNALTDLLRDQQLDIAIIADATGQTVATRVNERRPQLGQSSRIETALVSQGLTQPPSAASRRSGVLVHTRGVVFHGRAAILSPADRSLLGTVVIGELAPLNSLQTTAAATELSIRLYAAGTYVPEMPGARNFGTGVTVALLDNDEVVGRLAVQDAAGAPAGTLEIRFPSQFRGVLIHNAKSQLLAMAIVSVVIAALIWILVEFAFVRRLEVLARLIGRLDQPDAIQALQSFPGSDEVGRLARKTGQMAVHLSEARDLAVSADRAKSAFLRIVGHELRTPMNGVIGFSTLLRDTPLSQEQAEYVKAVEESGHVMLKLIDDLLDYTAMEASGVVLNPRPVRVREWVNGIMLLLRPQAARKHLAFEDEVSPEVPELIWVDTARLQQVVVHLLNNAIKFTSTGYVRLKIEIVRPGETPERLIRFRVLDSGMGIAPETRALLFKPLTPGDSSIARKHGGMGMGLVICERLVVAMGGTLAFHTEPGLGTEFFFSLPIHRDTAPAAPVPPSRVETFHRN